MFTATLCNLKIILQFQKPKIEVHIADCAILSRFAMREFTTE